MVEYQINSIDLMRKCDNVEGNEDSHRRNCETCKMIATVHSRPFHLLVTVLRCVSQP